MKKLLIILMILAVGCSAPLLSEGTDPAVGVTTDPAVDVTTEPAIVEIESDFALHGSQDIELYDTDENGDPIIIDDGPYDGYRWGEMRPMAWVPGMITQASYEMELPEVFTGTLGANYTPETLGADKYLEGYLGAVEFSTCAEVGQSVWINRGGGFEGPYLVADCARILNTYGQIVHEGVVAKVSFEVALDWGMAFLWQSEREANIPSGTKVHKTVRKWMQDEDSMIRNGFHYTKVPNVIISLVEPSEIQSEVVNLKEYFLERVRFQIGG